MSEPLASIEVLAPGLLTTVQDGRGRPDLGRYGVASGGALDPFAALAANLLVGNDPNATLLELTLDGPALRFTIETAFAIAGADLDATIDGRPVRPGWSHRARAGAILTFHGHRTGARAYVAVADGLKLPEVLGSSAADLRAGFGGLAGRALRSGDVLPITRVPDVLSRCGWALPFVAINAQPLRVLPGPHVDRFAPGAFEALCQHRWRITNQAERIGYRLQGTPLTHTAGADVASLGLPSGAVQVPGDGQPIVLLADHQPTGGYPVLACVIRADLGLLAQRVPGDPVVFTPTTVADARRALQARYAGLQSIERDERVWSALRLAGAGPPVRSELTPAKPI